MNAILAAFSNGKHILPSLLEKLQAMPFKSCEQDEVTIAALMDGRIQQKQFVKPFAQEEIFLNSQQNLTAALSLACIRDKDHVPNVHLAANSDMAVTYHGFIDNLSEIREQLFQLGYEVDKLKPSELILCFIRRYLSIQMPVREACLTAIRRLNGEFALIALFAEQKSLVIAQKGIPMTLAMQENEMYIASNLAGCLVQPVMLLEEESLLILRSFQK
jgi:glucosamine 6-phosphate synthetase-like amidotransferase/phosphosugar isomerase protein